MVSISPKIEQEVLSLPVQERLALIDKLIESLNFPKVTIIDDIWADIAEKRLLEINEGLVSSVSGNEIFSK
ncbi:addiction module protein [Methanospirillum sp. J.3.6.1-F.2.7.3]|jgi:hypothetical protein|uniref:Addiction module protein n=1 Tax=Methanospirillum purgamenti TaxID=2834276 RepID=A0A8E7AYR5_9EURY|nr:MULTISPECIES: addiction module protein [Methanospirillum]MDX8551323.1 addiction module protein [Methanospirillum hungatei]QVV87911.1 addiction module protein [Methanospirillum sp. J.3.6.1-F.2.7.3]